MSNTFQLLHISDLHVKQGDDFDRSVVLDPLIKRVAQDRNAGFEPEIVVVTGDIAFSGKEAEYKGAKTFFDDLLGTMNLAHDRLFIVPGNHDVDRSIYRPRDIPNYDTMKELNRELENENYRADLFKGMDMYFQFIETHYGHLVSYDNGLVPFVQDFTTEGHKKIGLVGLNSAWMCRKSDDEGEIALGEYQVKKAWKALQNLGKTDLVIYLFHHPLNWLWDADRKICKQYFNNSVLLCGHLHDAEGAAIQDLDIRYYPFQAGAAYEDSEFPNRFQYITFDWDENTINLDFRKFDKHKRRWVLEGEKGRDGKASITMMDRGDKKKPQPPVNVPEIPDSYHDWLLDRCRNMDTEKLCGKSEVITVRLPEVFIPLYTHAVEKTSLEPLSPGEKRVSIEELIGKKDSLLIEGHPGSGKTTLVKHLAHNLVMNKGPEGLDNFIPVVIFLRELKGFSAQGSSWKEILSFYFDRIENVLDTSVVDTFCRVNKALFLLDGLDEMETKERELLVNAFANFRNKHKGNKIVLTSRPHGLEGAAMQRFGDNHIKILSLDMDQIQDFIRKWFSHFYSSTSRVGRKNAEGMINEVKSHSAIERLIDNPLMLTAVCILYHDGKELPGQRAELYRKFVDNMLYRRFKDNELIHEFLMALAFDMHSKEIKGVDRVWAVEVLSRVYQKEEGEEERRYRKRIENQFDYIEPRCGLLKLEQGEYRFWHLTFQEFLTCRYIVDNRKDYDKAISDYWDQDWYYEVIELYIGYLSIENKKWANDIVQAVLETTDEAPFKRWLLACKSMIDIHKDRREPSVITKTKDTLLKIMSSSAPAKVRAEAGETLGWLGDPRDLNTFIPVAGGQYSLKEGTVTIEPFEISKYPVTNQWFEAFIRDGGYTNTEHWTEEGKKWLHANNVKHPRFWHDRKWNCPNTPVVGVTWYEACAFTRWLTLTRNDGHEYRLLTEEEWEAAASGLEGREYPWGNEWDKEKCNSKELNLEKTTSVGIFPQGSTPDGVSDLAGNVYEWTTSDYHSQKVLYDFAYDEKMDKLFQEYLDTRDDAVRDKLLSKLREKSRQLPVVRGGSWLDEKSAVRSFRRGYVNPDYRGLSRGFRCART